MWFCQGYNYGDTPPALKAQLRIEHADGSMEWIATDASWKADISPISASGDLRWRNYDARKEQAGLGHGRLFRREVEASRFDQPQEPEIVAQSSSPFVLTRRSQPRKSPTPSPEYIFTTFARTWRECARLQVRGAAGDDVQLRFAEVLNPDGTIYVENLRTAKATDHFILSGKGEEEFQPDFTFHGFRYVEVTGLKYKPDLNAVKAVALYTDAPITVKLQSGSPMINQLWSNILWGQRSNFVGVPTDCPQRDERLGWTADAQVFWRTASYNMDLTQFSKKFAAGYTGTPRWARRCTASLLREPIRQIPALAPGGAMPASSFPGPRGCNREIPGSSSRTGTRWRSISAAIQAAQSYLPMEDRLRHTLWRLAFS